MTSVTFNPNSEKSARKTLVSESLFLYSAFPPSFVLCTASNCCTDDSGNISALNIIVHVFDSISVI